MENSNKALVAEFIGTFTLVFVGTAVATLQGVFDFGAAGWLGISFAFGGTLMVLVLVIGPVSGCHLNPAVTIAMAFTGRMSKGAISYIIVQILAATAASCVLFLLIRGLPGYTVAANGLAANGDPRGLGTVGLFGFEVVMTALFLFTIFAATRDDFPAGFAALAIGGFLFIAHLVGAPLGDSSLNPARSLGPAMVEMFLGNGAPIKIVWVFVVAPIVGGLLGSVLYKLTYDD